MSTRKRRRRRQAHGSTLPGWAWMTFGLTLGVVLSGLLYLANDRDAPQLPATVDRRAPAPDVPAAVPTAPGARASAAPASAAPAAETAAESPPRFDFYEMLPSFEVVVPEVESQPRADRRPSTISEPGRYVLQAGSFKTFADADARAASLALLGIEARVQRVTIDSEVFHRVRIGPIENLDELNRVRNRLREARVEVLLMRVP